MRVCHLISGDLWGGAEAQALALLGDLSKREGVELRAVLLNEGILSDRLASLGVPVHVIDEGKLGFLGIRSALRGHLKRHPQDILHSHSYKENLLAASLGRRSRVATRLVKTVHGTREFYSGFRRVKAFFYTTLDRAAGRYCFDRIIAVSEDTRRRLEPAYPSRLLTVIPNAFDPEAIRPSRPPEDVRAELGLTSSEKILGTAGRLAPVKGYGFLLEAFKLIHDQEPGVRLLVIGEGPLEAELKNQARELGLAHAVLFPGFRTDIADLLNALDVFVMSSLHEGTPTVLLEALALQKPVVSTSVGGIPEVLARIGSGIQVRPGDPHALAAGCLRALEEVRTGRPDTREVRDRVLRLYSPQALGDRVLSLYRELLRRDP